ncbi:flagellin [Lysinibacillus composti]|uniref:Flagellin n=1 Tax=Lysinibacillus composti TaxID=720633 RepID=A0A3N9UH23_9BACI|nr:flagellin [Lysinibacillus composti]MBM7607968.1 flagellin [Lysinibacillus composti]RQW75429.1 hypothetical protein EBB45_06700 [Lysinibacillus composti]
MIINHNIAALRNLNHIKSQTRKSSLSMEKLSSGLRINQAADDATGLAISEKMRAQIRGLSQAQKNIQDGISLAQTVDGALSEIQDSLQRMRELTVQASNGTLTDEDRQEVQNEFSQLNQGLNNIVNETEFNTRKLLTTEVSHYLEWGKIQTNATGNFNDITTNGEMLIAVTNDGDVVSSSDGESWEKENNFSRILSNVYWDGDRFFATGERQTVAYSDNGKDWTVGIDGGSHYFFDIAKSGNIYMATGNAGRAYSNDGVNWSYWNPNLDQASSDLISNGTGFVWLQGSEIKTSSDGVNWTTHFDFYDTYNVGDVEIAYNGEKYIVSSRYGRTFTSTDLVNWTEGKTLTEDVLDLKWENNQFIATSRGEPWDNQSHISFSTDGIDWSSSIIEDPFINGVSSIDDKYVAVGSNGQVYKGTINNTSKPLTLHVGAREDQFKIILPNMSLTLEAINNLNVQTAEKATQAINIISQALTDISSERSKFGAYQNALEHIHSNVINYEYNLTAAESRIRDVDYALAA